MKMIEKISKMLGSHYRLIIVFILSFALFVSPTLFESLDNFSQMESNEAGGVTIEFPSNVVTKMVDGNIITVNDVAAKIHRDYTSHYYIISFPVSTVSSVVSKTNIETLVDAQKIGLVTLYPVIDEYEYAKVIGREVIEFDYNACIETCIKTSKTESSLALCNLTCEKSIGTETLGDNRTKNFTIYTGGSPTDKVDTTSKRKYLLEVRTVHGTEGEFNITVGDLKFDPVLSACGDLVDADTSYTLTGNVNRNGGNCFSIEAENVEINCQGNFITGDNTDDTVGVYMWAVSSRLLNCHIRGYDTGIFLWGSDYSTISNSSARSTVNNYVYPTYTNALLLYSGATYNTITGFNGYSQYGKAITFTEGSNYSNITNSVAQCENRACMLLYLASWNQLKNVTSISASSYALAIQENSNRTNVTNSTATSGSSYGIYLYQSAYTNFVNVTAQSTSNIAVNIDTYSHNNTFTSSTAHAGASAGMHAFSITGGEDNVINCEGRLITGQNTTDAFGVYSNQKRTTVKNCNITNFYYGVSLVEAHSSIIENINVSSTSSSGAGITINSSNLTNISNVKSFSTDGNAIYVGRCFNCTITNAIGTSTTGYGVHSWGLSTGLTLNNATGISKSEMGISLCTDTQNITASNIRGVSDEFYGLHIYSSKYTKMTNATGESGTSFGIYVEASNDTVFNRLTGTSNSSYAFHIDNSRRDVIGNSSFSSNGTVSVIFNSTVIYGSASSNLFYNNTIGGAGNLLNITAASGNNTFYWNNFTNTSGLYSYDLNGTNFYNSSANGTNLGNIYWNVLNGSITLTGTVTSPWADLNYSNGGSGYPYNITTSLGKLSCNFYGCGDYAPLHRVTASSNVGPTINTSISFANGTSHHWLNATATAEDTNGAADITSWQATTANGTCYNLTNNTTGNLRTVTINCSGTGLQATSINITFYDAAYEWASTNGSTSYPNQKPVASGLSPDGGDEYAAEEIIINFTLTDADNDNRTAYVWVSNDSGSTWSYLGVSEVNGTSYTWNASTYTALGTYRVKITPSDDYENGTNVSSSSDFSIRSCRTLNAANSVYTLLNDTTIYTENCFVVTAENVTINCAGHSIVGNNYGGGQFAVYSTQFNTSIIDCNIYKFYPYNIYFVNAANGSVINTTSITTSVGAYAIYYNGGDYASIINTSTETDLEQYGIKIISNYANVINSSIKGSAYGLYVSTSTGTTINNNFIKSNLSTQALYLTSVNNSIISNNTINGSSFPGQPAFSLLASLNNTVVNNTIKYGFQAQVSVDSASYGNIFYWNNFTNTTQYYLSDTNGSNFYNYSANGTNMGNFWHNVVNGSVVITGTTTSIFGGFYYGDAGAGYPYTNDTSLGKFSCNFAGCADNAPLTPMQTAADTCTYTSGNWAINCSDNCTLTSSVDIGGYNISIIGTGVFILNGANITNYEARTIMGDSSTNQCVVRRINGGGFRS